MTVSDSWSRRDFLKVTGLALSAALLPPLPPEEAPRRPTLLGRTIYFNNVYAAPTFNARQIGVIPSETVVGIYNTVQSTDNYYNRTWYEIQRGYIHSASVQPVRWIIQQPITDFPKDGFLGEVSVPATLAKPRPAANYNTTYRFYYETTHWITDIDEDDAGDLWYQVFDDRYDKYYWVLAATIRRVSAAELTPLSPNVTDKRIEVDLDRQTFRAFENGELVLDTLCSTGPYLRTTPEGVRQFGTPTGDWIINRKRPTRHMAGDDGAADDFFDLPGVPWVSYFHWWGVSIHGTYWHNDYGRPRSHGCVNLLPEHAKWVFRWTMPASLGKEHETLGDGTPVIVSLSA
ncbi:MAG: L,D-transpeptidase [Anaerolineales bacterium]|nr:L,D-transpeptidase [Anaerolineales bacterium]